MFEASNADITATTYSSDTKRKRFDVTLNNDALCFNTYVIKEPGSTIDIEYRWLEDKYFPTSRNFNSYEYKAGYHPDCGILSFPLDNINNLVSIQRFLKGKDNDLNEKIKQSMCKRIEKKLDTYKVKDIHQANIELDLRLVAALKPNHGPRHLVTLTLDKSNSVESAVQKANLVNNLEIPTSSGLFTVHILRYPRDIFDNDTYEIGDNPYFSLNKFEGVTVHAAGVSSYNRTLCISGPITGNNLKELNLLVARDVKGYSECTSKKLVHKPIPPEQQTTSSASEIRSKKSGVLSQ